MSIAETYASQIELAWHAYLTAHARPAQQPHASVYASAYRVCERRMVYELTGTPDQVPPWPTDVLAKFRRGDDRERNLLADLARIGRDAKPPFRVVSQQEHFKLHDRKGRVAITGKVDARLATDGVRAPVEVKACSPLVVDRIETFSDLFTQPWTRSGAYQLLAYLYGAGEAYGFLLLDRAGVPRLLPVELDAHLDQMEEFLARAERVLDHRDAGTLPDYLDDAPECQRCPWYGGTCNPPITSASATVLTDPDLEAALERREQLKAARSEERRVGKDGR